ncbi:hypothetical protein C477_15840 [Haloterrigena salina JCM 13891]|uniref:Uncharacterized protein n=1 Tax=Haloterrigena salina JCM 13891 TaxID=1227488 RepID=M0C1J7_9EURY|nr:hypothetical protein C477_15840 [Haloterrigena salina JCM 13891]
MTVDHSLVESAGYQRPPGTHSEHRGRFESIEEHGFEYGSADTSGSSPSSAPTSLTIVRFASDEPIHQFPQTGEHDGKEGGRS